LKTRLALILGIICIAVSAVTLYSVLSHAEGVQTVTFVDNNNATSPIKGAQILGNDPKRLKIDMAPVSFPRVGDLSMVIIRFSNEYEASVARDLLMSQKLNLETTYLRETRLNHPPIPSVVGEDGSSVRGQTPQAVFVWSDKMFVSLPNKIQKPTLQDLVSEQVRIEQWNKGDYTGSYYGISGSVWKWWDKQNCHGTFNTPQCNEDKKIGSYDKK
jgi:hypothetical protein